MARYTSYILYTGFKNRHTFFLMVLVAVLIPSVSWITAIKNRAQNVPEKPFKVTTTALFKTPVSVGPYSQRKATDSYLWGGQNYNDVGTAEFAMHCKSAGAETQTCVNMYHPSKRMYDLDFTAGHGAHGYGFPKFMNLTDGKKLILYVCNRTSTIKEPSFDLSDFTERFANASVTQLCAGPVAMNTHDHKNAINQTAFMLSGFRRIRLLKSY